MKGKSNSWYIAVIVLLSVIILLMGSVFALIFYPISRFFGTINITPKFSTEQTRPVRSVEDIIDTIRVSPETSSEIDITLTEEEISLIINTFLESSNDIVHVDDVYVKCNRNQTVDIFATTKNMDVLVNNTSIPDFLRTIASATNNMPVFINASISHVTDNYFMIDINEARLQSLPLPVGLFGSVTDSLSKAIASQLDSVKGFKTRSFIIEEGSITFKGISGDIS